MKAKLIKVIEIKKSANGAKRCYLLCLKGADGKSYKTYTDENLGNFKRWYNAIVGLVSCTSRNEELMLDNLKVKAPGLVDADSMFTMEVVAPAAWVPPQVEVNEVERKDTQ